jgi:hypothetical protein
MTRGVVARNAFLSASMSRHHRPSGAHWGSLPAATRAYSGGLWEPLLAFADRLGLAWAETSQSMGDAVAETWREVALGAGTLHGEDLIKLGAWVGLICLDACEQTVNALADLQQRVADGSGLEVVRAGAAASGGLARTLTRGYAQAIRDLAA